MNETTPSDARVQRAFISHCPEDGWFVRLLVRNLEFHRVRTWSSSEDIAHGSQWRDEIAAALGHADALIVVVSEHSRTSTWVVKEVVTYETSRPDGLVIPVKIDATSLDSMVDGLSRYQAIDFFVDHLTGYQQLLGRFGKEFLPIVDRRAGADRRDGDHPDRRVAKVDQRMRVGFWKKYSAETGYGEFQEIGLLFSDMQRAIDSLLPEAQSYKYSRDGVELAPRDVLERAVHETFRINRASGHALAVFVIDQIVDLICGGYVVEMIDRREQARRESEKRSK